MCSTTYRKRYRLEIRIGISEVCQHCFTNEKIFFHCENLFQPCLLTGYSNNRKFKLKRTSKEPTNVISRTKNEDSIQRQMRQSFKRCFFSPFAAAAKHSKFKANKSCSFSKLEKIFQKSFILLNLRFCWLITQSKKA